MSKILEDHGNVPVTRNERILFVKELLLDCGCTIQIDSKDLYDALNYDLTLRLRVEAHRCAVVVKQLPENAEVNAPLDGHYQAIEELQRQLLVAQQEAGMWRDKYEHLSVTYNKLADQWNVFQATNRPDNRNIQRAEGAGEAARKLAEVFLALAYDRDAHDLIATLVEMLQDLQRGGAGRTVEVSEKLVRSPDRG